MYRKPIITHTDTLHYMHHTLYTCTCYSTVCNITYTNTRYTTLLYYIIYTLQSYMHKCLSGFDLTVVRWSVDTQQKSRLTTVAYSGGPYDHQKIWVLQYLFLLFHQQRSIFALVVRYGPLFCPKSNVFTLLCSISCLTCLIMHSVWQSRLSLAGFIFPVKIYRIRHF